MKMQKKFYLLLLLIVPFLFPAQGCDKLDGISPTAPGTERLQAVISFNEDMPPGRIDSVLKGIPTLISGARSTGNIQEYRWWMYRARTGVLVDTASGKIISRTFTQVDTLNIRLQVRGSGGLGDTTSVWITLRILNSFSGGASVGDVRLGSSLFVQSGIYDYSILCPKRRIPSGSLNDPATTGTHNIWGITPISNPNDTTVEGDWKFNIRLNDGDVLRWNYMGNRSTQVWSISDGSNFKTPGENTYQVYAYGGSLYRVGTGPSSPVPGVYGDTVMRFDTTVDSLFIYPNLRFIPNQAGNPWSEMNLYAFVRKYMTESSYTGYGRIAVPMELVRQYSNIVKIRYGGNAMATMTGSNLYSNAEQMIVFQLVSPRPGIKPMVARDQNNDSQYSHAAKR